MHTLACHFASEEIAYAVKFTIEMKFLCFQRQWQSTTRFINVLDFISLIMLHDIVNFDRNFHSERL